MVRERTVVTGDDAALLLRLRSGDATAFEEIVIAWSPAMLRVARTFVRTAASAEEVVQETWLAVLRGLHTFEGRSSLRTWTFRVLANIARTRAVREGRTIPWSSLAGENDTPAEDPRRFRSTGAAAGSWTPDGRPEPWVAGPESHALAGEVRGLLGAALAELPERQKVVVTLRDIEGFDSDEVCELLDISAANQRVLLHRARVKLRATLEPYYRSRPCATDHLAAQG